MVKVLFVCVANSCRSQIAEAVARRLGAGLVEAHSTGTQPGAAVDPRAVAAMARRGYDLSEAAPKPVDEVPAGPYEWMVRMGCGDVLLVPALHREDWPLPNPDALPDDDFEALCGDIEARVRDLVARAGAWAEATGFPLAPPAGDGASVALPAEGALAPAPTLTGPTPPGVGEASGL